ncbi:STAS domain-containing protein [Streptomyces sp. MMBL 11-3]|uniref:STAS domain-containing protein n=1 Tax=Streptomyces sp. MMBL 11-3 TaxID=3382639 RepID=UPI0039B42045
MQDQWPIRLQDCRVVSPSGELDIAASPGFSFLLRGNARAVGADWLIVDLTQVTFMDCSALHDLCAAFARSRTTGRWTRLVYDQAPIDRLLLLTRLHDRFPRYESVDTAWRQRPVDRA